MVFLPRQMPNYSLETSFINGLKLFLNPDKSGAKPAATEPAPAASAPAKRLDNLFFIEEPKTTTVTESKYDKVILS